MATPLMPHATAAWLVDNTGLSFSQIAEFCGIHILEVQAMADDMTGSKYTGRDPDEASAGGVSSPAGRSGSSGLASAPVTEARTLTISACSVSEQ